MCGSICASLHKQDEDHHAFRTLVKAYHVFEDKTVVQKRKPTVQPDQLAVAS